MADGVVAGPLPRDVSIEGPEGMLEGVLLIAERDSGKAAVLCHPHPNFGGSMHDVVLDVLSGVLLSHGIHCLRFNFRGVGASAGGYDGGTGESEDTLAAVRWLNDELTPEGLWLAGYSFGAMTAWRASAPAQAQDIPLEQIVLVAPVARMGLDKHSGADIPLCVAVGDCDEFTDAQALTPWTESLANETKLIEIVGANHFFAGVAADLGEELDKALFGQ